MIISASVLPTGNIAQCKPVIFLSFYMEVPNCGQGFLPLNTRDPLQSWPWGKNGAS